MKNIHLALGIFSLLLFSITASAQAAEKSLYERLGGKPAVTAVVSQFVDYNSADKVIRSRWDPEHSDDLKQYLVELVCQASGGGCVYTGKHMDVAHAGLNVTEDEFNRVAANLVKALDKFNVPEKEKGELLAIIGSLKGKVVGQ